MESPEEFTASNDHTVIVAKGKRTKRPRTLVLMSSSLSSGGGGGSGGEEGVCSSLPSSTSSGEISMSTEGEDEDMAKCLILLAQGVSPKIRQLDQQQEEAKINGKSSTVTTAKASFYIYECRTCNRTFPSFQALGGHRASHKKQKTIPQVLTPPFDDDDDDDDTEEDEGQLSKTSPTISLQILAPKSSQIKNNSSKVHGCSICGSEFMSGQALGGHMRRHRAAPNSRIAMISSTIDTSTTKSESHDKPRNVMSLDLNLPAPLEVEAEVEDDHIHKEAKFQFRHSNKHLGFSTSPVLVDCHY